MTDVTVPRTADLSWGIAPSHRHRLPEGKLSFTVGITAEDRPHLLAAYVGIPDHEGAAARSDELACGRMVVDWNDDGRLIGIEFLSPPSDEEICKALHAYIQQVQAQERDARLILVAWATVMRTWGQFQLALDLKAKGLDSDQIEEALGRYSEEYRRLCPQAENWDAAEAEVHGNLQAC